MLTFVSSSYAADTNLFVPGHILSIPYHLPVQHKGRLSLTFPMSIQQALGERSYFFAQQFQFLSGHIGYIGARPWMGKHQLSLAFSVFGHDVKVRNEKLCRYGADSGPGVSCSKIVPYVPGKKFYLMVKKYPNSASRWQGFFMDKPDGKPVMIGDWEVPPSWGNLLSKQVGFIEYFMKVKSCLSIPQTEVTFYPPLHGKLEKPYIKFCDICARKGGVPSIKEEIRPQAFHFIINSH